jgi:hypothetical protein
VRIPSTVNDIRWEHQQTSLFDPANLHPFTDPFGKWFMRMTLPAVVVVPAGPTLNNRLGDDPLPTLFPDRPSRIAIE